MLVLIMLVLKPKLFLKTGKEGKSRFTYQRNLPVSLSIHQETKTVYQQLKNWGFMIFPEKILALTKIL